MIRQACVLSIAAFAIAAGATADTAYIEPSTFAPQPDQTITIEVSFNDYCCVPKYPVRSDAYAVILPNGTKVAPDRMEVFSNSTILEHTLRGSGTTRFTTGERLGRKGGEYVLLNGAYHMINGDEAPAIEVPPDTPILSSQTATVSDAYVTIGEPTWESVHTPMGRLEINTDQHPSMIKVGDTLGVTLFFDGRPLVAQDVVMTRSGQKDRDQDDGVVLVSNADGKVSIPLTLRGTHLIMTRLQAPAPDGADTDIRSYTTSLTFDVAQH